MRISSLVACFLLAGSGWSIEPTHLLYPRMVENRGTLRGELVLHRIPGSSAEAIESAENLQRVCDWLSGWAGIQDIHDGRLFCTTGGGRSAIIGLDGDRTELTHSAERLLFVPAHNRIVWTTPRSNQVLSRQLGTTEAAQLVAAAEQRPFFLGGAPHSRMVLSPAGHCLATASYEPDREKLHLHPYRIRVHHPGQPDDPPLDLGTQWLGGSVSTGAGNSTMAPAMFWRDDVTLLVLAGHQDSFQVNPNALDDSKRFRLYQIRIQDDASVETSEVCEVPIPMWGMMNPCFDPIIWQRSDGAVMLRSRGRGDLRVDFEKRKTVADGRLSSRYELKGDAFYPSLHFNGKLLIKKVAVRDISVSPDGRQICWLTPEARGPNAFSHTHAVKRMWLHSEMTGTLMIGQGRYAGRGCLPHDPTKFGLVRWVTIPGE